MPENKLQYYAELAEQTARQLTDSLENWTTFLDTAARLYKYPYHEQLMIYAQRPDATACADYDTWNKTMRRYIRRGTKGIALLDQDGDTPKLKYVYDLADTGTRQGPGTGGHIRRGSRFGFGSLFGLGSFVCLGRGGSRLGEGIGNRGADRIAGQGRAGNAVNRSALGLHDLGGKLFRRGTADGRRLA